MKNNRRRLIILSTLMAAVWFTLLGAYVHLTLRLLQMQKEWTGDILIGFIAASVMLFILIWCFFTIIVIVRRERKMVLFKEKMVHSVIHELKTPITTINLACQLLQDKTVPTDQEATDSYIEMISNESKSLEELVEEVLMVFRADKIPGRELHEVSVHELLHSMVNVHRLALEECGAKVNFDLQADCDTVMGESTHLGNALSNLIDNAIKYRNGDLVLSISTRNVNNMIEIRIVDNGIGIDSKDQILIFEPFSRVNSDNAQYVKGYGLGLSYVKYVTDYHKGTIKVESEKGKGATFVLSLPVKNQ